MKILYKNLMYIDYLDTGVETFKIGIKDTMENIFYSTIVIPEIEESTEERLVTNLHFENRVLVLQIALSTEEFIYLYLDRNELVVRKESATQAYSENIDLFSSYKLINNFDDMKIVRTGLATFSFFYYDNYGELNERKINEILSRKKMNIWKNIETSIENDNKESMITVSSIELEKTKFFITYFPKRKQINFSKVQVEILDDLVEDYHIKNKNEINLSINGTQYTFDFRKSKKEEIVLEKDLKLEIDYPMRKIKINNQLFYIYCNNGSLCISGNQHLVFGYKIELSAFFSKNDLYIVGSYENNAEKRKIDLDSLYIKGIDVPIAKFKRISSKFVFCKISLSTLLDGDEIHRSIRIGSERESYYPLFLKRKIEKFQVFCQKRVGSEIILLRGNVGGGTSFTRLPFSKEYTSNSRLKIWLAYYLNKISLKRKKVNLYFEKKSSKADESAIHVFRKVIETNPNSKNYFVINKEAESYLELKKEFGKKILDKYTFRHYFKIFQSDCFISTELSNHVINDRIFLNKIRSKITKTPLIFLQHGIMFAKPIDNPMAAGFRKQNLGINLKKVVINSELEAEEFYKVGYVENDLLLTGLATFDYAKLDDDADKIAYMPTYRYWEEHLVYTGRILETSYYDDLITVLESFKSAGLLNKLLLVPHNKFGEYIKEAFPEYENNIEVNPSKALRKANIFITDYSSAIYDAIVRGAYPIFYWKEKEYLIENYKAVPPVNEENAPGVIANNEEQLITQIRKAYEQDLKISDEIKKKYKEINQFNDKKNTVRIVSYLLDQNIV